MKNLKRKNVAVCFSGQVRKFDLCYPYIKKNLLDHLGSYDIFCCAEDDSDLEKMNVLNPVKIKKIKSSEVEKILKPVLKVLNKNNYKKYIFPQSPRFNFKNILQQLFKLQGSYELLEEYMQEEKVSYDFFIRIRFDFLPLDAINPKNFVLKNNEVITPHLKSSVAPKTQINDMFAITKDLNTFKTYCTLYNNFESAVQKVKFNPSKKQRIYFAFEKIYSDFFFWLSKMLDKLNKKFSRNLLGLSLLLPKKIYFKFKQQNRADTERVFYYHLTSNKKKIREEKLNFVIVRNPMEGLLVFG